jgi:hypothetical protein
MDARLIAHFNAEPQHLVQGELFMLRGVQFRVMACEPESGMTDASTHLFSDGPPVPDLTRVHVLPVYNSLPNAEKDISESDVFDRYLLPYFLGTGRFLQLGEILTIDDVEFKVVAAEPPAGLVTSRTVIFANGAPLRADDLRQQQLHADAELARRLSQEDGALRGGYPGAAGGAGRGAAAAVRAGGDLAEIQMLQAHMQHMMSRLPAQSNQRRAFERLNQQLVQVQQGGAGAAHAVDGPGSFSNFLRLLMANPGGGRPSSVVAANESEISTLPTRRFTVPSGAADPDSLKYVSVLFIFCCCPLLLLLLLLLSSSFSSASSRFLLSSSSSSSSITGIYISSGCRCCPWLAGV